jgi:hypothetical protein
MIIKKKIDTLTKLLLFLLSCFLNFISNTLSRHHAINKIIIIINNKEHNKFQLVHYNENINTINGIEGYVKKLLIQKIKIKNALLLQYLPIIK